MVVSKDERRYASSLAELAEQQKKMREALEKSAEILKRAALEGAGLAVRVEPVLRPALPAWLAPEAGDLAAIKLITYAAANAQESTMHHTQNTAPSISDIGHRICCK